MKQAGLAISIDTIDHTNYRPCFGGGGASGQSNARSVERTLLKSKMRKVRLWFLLRAHVVRNSVISVINVLINLIQQKFVIRTLHQHRPR